MRCFRRMLHNGKKDGDERDLAAICRYIDSFEIEMIHFVPSMLRLFLKYIEKKAAIPH